MDEGSGDGGTVEGGRPSVISRLRDREDVAVYREDDSTFKNRLKENLMDHWLLNTIGTLVIAIGLFYFLTGDIFIGIVAGLLILIVSNLSNVLWRIRDFERWEIFSNGVKLGYDPRGRLKFIRFSDIMSLTVHKGFRGDVLVIDVGERRLRFPYGQNRDVFDLLLRKYEAFQEIQRVPEPVD
jgi:hypothetical protein